MNYSDSKEFDNNEENIIKLSSLVGQMKDSQVSQTSYMSNSNDVQDEGQPVK